jgi:predicted DNA binding protein
MITVADVSVSADAFVLSKALRRVSEMNVVIEPVVTFSQPGLAPYFRAIGNGFSRFERALEADPTLQTVTRVESTEHERVYFAQWGSFTGTVLPVLQSTGGNIVYAAHRDQNWHLRLAFANRGALSEFHDRCRRDLPMTLERVTDRLYPAAGGAQVLTAAQQETLLTALRGGYFEVPREMTQSELADRLGISSQSVSQRLRRGQRNLLTHAFALDYPISH